MFESMKILFWNLKNRKGRIALDELAWLILGVLALVALVFVIMYFSESLYDGAKKFFRILGG